MTQMTAAGPLAGEDRARVAALLTRYPRNTPEELAEIANWFERVASPLDFGLLASDPEVEPGYRAYRAEHYDRFRPRDLVKAVLFVGVAGGFIAALLLMAPS